MRCEACEKKRMGGHHDPSCTPEQRFWAKVEKTETCWIWTGAVYQNTGYGAAWMGNGVIGAHRVAYELTHGSPIPKKHKGQAASIDHLCRNKRCVNPDHLELVTQQENIRRGAHGDLKEACVHGHAYPENQRHSRTGTRFCIACRRESDRLRAPARRTRA